MLMEIFTFYHPWARILSSPGSYPLTFYQAQNDWANLRAWALFLSQAHIVHLLREEKDNQKMPLQTKLRKTKEPLWLP